LLPSDKSAFIWIRQAFQSDQFFYFERGDQVDSRSFHLHDGKKGAALAVRVIPRSSRNEIAEVLHDGTVKVRLTLAADDQKLNQELVNFLADTLDVPRNRLDVVAGVGGLDKLVSVLDLDASSVQARIIKKLS
jgi:uncharacterized protein